ncbi:hypothetical protein CMO88_01350 [Candidatus Woesearchaeota archaeon]|nr:hypothetical protein [Candidatus Woesearchaeota archaeon]|tara:strand:- start:18640 stop:19533 length:894 start_codon:yes stop_codon:yes gene_type:complete
MTFGAKLIDLDECVIYALDLFIQKGLPKLSLGNYKRPLVVGSGNAAVTGRIILKDSDAVFADEGTYKEKLKTVKEIDGAILISASGGKHAPIIAKELKKKGIEVRLLTNNKDAAARKHADKTFVFPKNIEPYTYNTSTYMSMIMAKTKENPKKILEHIKKSVDAVIPKNLRKYDAYFIILPTEFDNIREMLATKFDELFGPKISGRVFTPEQTKHAKTVVPAEREFFLSIGYDNKDFGKKRLNISLPKWAGPATVMAISYYFIGHIQKQNPPYFKKNIFAYTKNASRIFKQEIKPLG